VTKKQSPTPDSRLLTLSELQQRVDAWISQFEEGYFHPLTNMARLAEEVGELAREVNHRFGQKTKKREEPEGDLAMEMADILFVLICMANREGVDLDAAFQRMMEKVQMRDETRWTKKREATPTPSARSPAPPAAPGSSPTDPDEPLPSRPPHELDSLAQ
jgi:NTP pyrophosphatase (non-canonical NTP hydrolase)